MLRKPLIVGVVGASRASSEGLTNAREVGRLIAESGGMMVCGGLGGIMQAAAQGCAEAGGTVIGILPGDSARDANPFVSIPIVTDMGHARNVIIAHTADVLIAIEGEYGTLSEMAVAIKLGKQVYSLGSWDDLPGGTKVANAQEAVAKAFNVAGEIQGG